ncbi:hypothetical protein FRB91_011830 [Serendipita sp. 411]|nr:hypothetical protein FRC19_010618 [Serendipita sp. 401]KAG8847382.1 hypothetical protein FRB91_011830 [Serendipita sp. 411]KAG9051866.1 hypothetical protein FS842_010906 [Serendipita sp. 407]
MDPFTGYSYNNLIGDTDRQLGVDDWLNLPFDTLGYYPSSFYLADEPPFASGITDSQESCDGTGRNGSKGDLALGQLALSPTPALPHILTSTNSTVPVIEDNTYETEFDSRVSRLDKGHRALVTSYSGESSDQKLKVLRFVERYMEQNGDQKPMRIESKVSSTGKLRLNAAPAKVHCAICGFTSPTIQKTAAHLLSVHAALVSPSDPSGLFKCKILHCNAVYRRNDELRKHLRMIHQVQPKSRKGRVNSTCMSCGSTRRNKVSLIPSSSPSHVPPPQPADLRNAIAIPSAGLTTGRLPAMTVRDSVKDDKNDTDHHDTALTILMGREQSGGSL